jgi:hypothetical protein
MDILKHEVPEEGWYDMTFEAIGEHPEKDGLWVARFIIDNGKHTGKRVTNVFGPNDPMSSMFDTFVDQCLCNRRQKVTDLNNLSVDTLMDLRIRGHLEVIHKWTDGNKTWDVADRQPDRSVKKEFFMYAIIDIDRPEFESQLNPRMFRNKAKFSR